VEAADQALAAERLVFAKGPLRRPLEEKTQADDGYYLFGWTIPEIAFRITLPDTSRHLPHVVMDRPQRVGGPAAPGGSGAGLRAAHAGHRAGRPALLLGRAGTDGQPAGLLGRPGPFWRPAPWVQCQPRGHA